MSLADHWSDGKYLTEGWHEVVVKAFEVFTYNSGNSGVKFTVEGEGGRASGTDGFSLLPQALWKLAGFAQACGMTKEECCDYNPDDPNSHAMLVGRKLQVLVQKEKEKYHRAVEWESVESITSAAASPPVDAPTRAALPDTAGFKPKPVEPEGECPF